jgi:DnaJ-class molecular chaperone
MGSDLRGDVLLTLDLDMGIFIIPKSISNKVRVYDDDLMLELSISLAEALCGFSRIIKMPSGYDFEYISYDVIKDDDLYAIENEGLRRRNGKRGILYIRFKITEMPPMPPEMKRKMWEILTGTPYFKTKFKLQPNVSKVCIGGGGT